MERTAILTKVQGIVVDRLGADLSAATEEAHIVDDLGADSLDRVDLIMEVEKQFNVAIPDAAAEGLETIGQVVDYIEKNQTG